MKCLLCLFLCLCVNWVLCSPNKIPDKYKNNPFFELLKQKVNNRNNPILNPPKQELSIKYAHNPFLSQLFTNKTTPKIRKPPVLINNRYQTIKKHRNFHLLPSRDTCGLQSLSYKISFGNEAAIGQYPWMALLEYRIKKISIGYQCAGILINDRYILTAAHCVRAKSMSIGEKLFRVRLGEHDISKLRDCENDECNDPPLDVEIEETIMHPDYDVNSPNFHHDIALLRLRRKIRMTQFIKPICLPFDGESTKPGVNMHIAGWGFHNDADSLSKVKMFADIPYIKDSECKKLWKRKINIIDSQFCAGGTSRTNVCQGDSGGPIMTTFQNTDQWYVEGIISFGSSICGGDPFPTVYTRVSSYINWILDNLKE